MLQPKRRPDSPVMGRDRNRCLLQRPDPFQSKLATMKDLLAWLKANPGKANIGTINVGSTQNLAAELLVSLGDLDAEGRRALEPAHEPAREALGYVLRDMTHPEGGFFSAEDADSAGEEGRFYTWSAAEIRTILGAEVGERFCRVFDVTDGGNFEGRNILHLPKTFDQCAALLHGATPQLV